MTKHEEYRNAAEKALELFQDLTSDGTGMAELMAGLRVMFLSDIQEDTGEWWSFLCHSSNVYHDSKTQASTIGAQTENVNET